MKDNASSNTGKGKADDYLDEDKQGSSSLKKDISPDDKHKKVKKKSKDSPDLHGLGLSSEDEKLHESKKEKIPEAEEDFWGKVPAPFEEQESRLEEEEKPLEGEIIPEKAKETLEDEAVEGKLKEEGPSEETKTPFQQFILEVKKVLGKSKITKKYIIVVVAGCFGFIILVVILIFALRFILSLGEWVSEEEPAEEEAVTEEIAEEAVDSSVETGAKLGADAISEEEVALDSSLESGILLGGLRFVLEIEGSVLGDFSDLGEVARQLEQLEKLMAIYKMNVNEVLSASDNRAKALEEHLALLKQAYDEGRAIYDYLEEEITKYKGQYNANIPVKDSAELTFFDSVKLFDGEAVQESLNQFVELAGLQADLKAQYLARVKLRGLYFEVLKRMKPIIKDIELNQEALALGIKIIKVPGSKLDLVVPEKENLGD